jgi:hypothetical protein
MAIWIYHGVRIDSEIENLKYLKTNQIEFGKCCDSYVRRSIDQASRMTTATALSKGSRAVSAR